MHHLVGMAEIAEILGVSRQRVAQLIETYEDFPKPEIDLTAGRVWSRTAIETWIASHPDRGPGRAPEGAGMFERFTDLARSSIVKAQEEARLLNHNFIGTEHLILGLMAVREGAAFVVLRSLGLTYDDLREQVVTMIGRGPATPHGHIPFTPRAKKCLELSLREALALKRNYIGTEHVLLGLIREKEGVARKALVALDIDPSNVRSALKEYVEERIVEAATGAAGTLCSFCGKGREHVTKLIAGPGVYICNECVDLCNEILTEEIGAPEAERTLQLRIDDLERRLEELEGK